MRMCFFIGAIDPLRFFPLLIDDLRGIGSRNRPPRTLQSRQVKTGLGSKFHKKSGLQIFARTIFVPRAGTEVVDGLSSPMSRRSDRRFTANQNFSSRAISVR